MAEDAVERFLQRRLARRLPYARRQVAVLSLHERMQIEVRWIGVLTLEGFSLPVRIMDSMHDCEVHPQHLLRSIGVIRDRSS